MSFLVLAAFLSLAPQAQAPVWIVRATPGGDFTSLAAAVMGASAGDTLLVESSSGTSASTVVIDKPLTIQARGALVPLHEHVRVVGLAAGGSLVLRGFQIDWLLDLSSNPGTVWIEDCVVGKSGCPYDGLSNSYLPMGLSVTSCADVILVGTSVRGNNGCEGGVISDINAGVAVVVSFSTLHAYECTFRGGDAFTAYSMSWSNGEAGLKENGSSFVMLSGCQISGGDSACWDYGFCAGYPGTGFKHNSGQAYALDTTIQAGAPGSAGLSCTCSRPDHTGAGTVQVLSGQALDLRTDSPKREGETFTYTIVGPPNVPVWLGTSLRTGGQFLSSFRGSVLIGLPPLSLRSVGTTDATGALSVTQVVPSILTGPSGIRLFVQPYYSSPIVLGRGACVLALDSSL